MQGQKRKKEKEKKEKKKIKLKEKIFFRRIRKKGKSRFGGKEKN
jgi:hypothetical protein